MKREDPNVVFISKRIQKIFPFEQTAVAQSELSQFANSTGSGCICIYIGTLCTLYILSYQSHLGHVIIPSLQFPL